MSGVCRLETYPGSVVVDHKVVVSGEFSRESELDFYVNSNAQVADPTHSMLAGCVVLNFPCRKSF